MTSVAFDVGVEVRPPESQCFTPHLVCGSEYCTLLLGIIRCHIRGCCSYTVTKCLISQLCIYMYMVGD